MTFTKTDTNIVKGVAILMLLYHHLFESVGRYKDFEIYFPGGEELSLLIAMFFKICVSIFVFLTGYGITASLMKLGDDRDAVRKMINKRYVSLMMPFFFIFILGTVSVLIKDVVVADSSIIKGVYGAEYRYDSVFYILVDFLGLSELFGTPTLCTTWWYMSLALILIFAVPLMYKIQNNYGVIALFMATFATYCIFEKENSDMVRWLFTAALGIVSCRFNLLGKIKDFKFIKSQKYVDFGLKFVLYSAIVVFIIPLRFNITWIVPFFRDGIIPMMVIIYCFVILAEIPGLNKVLEFFGKHSMTIFLSHTFLRVYFLKDFIYGRGNAILIYLVMISVSLVCALVIEGLQKLTRYDVLTQRVIEKVSGK